MKVYLAGPMRGIPNYNFPAFDDARDWLIEEGYEVINPADLDRAIGIGGYCRELPDDFIYDALKRDFAAILTCDAIVLLPRWEDSSGVAAEKAVAEWIGLEVLALVKQFGEWAVRMVTESPRV